MRIAIHTSDLDDQRIDGTRVYILKMLEYFGKLDSEDEFFLYHKNEFNPELVPPSFPNYAVKKIYSPAFWTQTGFAMEVFRDNPDVLWMPMHNIPLLRRKGMKTIVTIHDLAFKVFPEYFPKKDLRKLNFLANLSIQNSDGIIAVSEATKKDILKFYPEVSEEKIKVIHHGFDEKMFSREVSDEKVSEVLGGFSLLNSQSVERKAWSAKSKTQSVEHETQSAKRETQNTNPKSQLSIPNLNSLSQISNLKSQYLLYVGAIQPRKDLVTLIGAFEIFKKKTKSEMKLVIAGGKAWMWEGTFEAIEKSLFKKDIVLTGKVSFDELAVLYQNAKIFIFPEMYAGFGIPILEAFSAGVPVVAARNSSLIEVGGEGAQFFETGNAVELSDRIEMISNSEETQKEMIEKGRTQLKNFSWEKCAKETLKFLIS